jgi:hypothetical protein
MRKNPVGDAAQLYRTVTINPAVNAGLQGTAAFGVGVIGWNRLMETLRSMLRRPASLALKMSPQEFDREIEDIKNDSKMRWILPGALGTGIMGLSLAASHRPNEEYGGLLSWNAKAKPLDPDRFRGYIMPGTQNLEKAAALQKFASELTEYGGWVPSKELANSYAKVIDAPAVSQALFSNDPWMQNDIRTRCTGQAIFADAQNREGSSNVSFGTLRDSARDKMSSKFSLMGITNIAANTMFANLGADLFINAVGAMTGLPQNAREDLISTATWYQAAKSILT